MKILFLSKIRSYGISYGLKNSISFIIETLNNYKNVECKHIEVIDANYIDKEVTNYNPDIVIIEALWITPEKIKELLHIHRHKKRNWVIRIHSDVGFLSTEGIAFKWIKKIQKLNFKNLYISVNNLDFAKALKDVLHKKVLWLPNIYPEYNFSFTKKSKNDNIIDVGCFGALRSLKNQTYQALVALKYAEENNLILRFHINNTPIEQDYNPIFNNLKHLFEDTKHKLVLHNWLNHDEFLKVIKNMDFGMQISYTESFNIVSADFISQGVPIIISNAIKWLPWYLKTSTTNYNKTKSKIDLILKIRNNRLFDWYSKYKLKSYNTQSISQWINVLHI